jgi:predicted NBD/HSP70 family sugar kinase
MTPPLTLPDEIPVFDVGGTSLRAALYRTAAGTLSTVLRRPTPTRVTLEGADADRIRRTLYDEMDAMRRELVGERTAAAVAVAFPGPVDPRGRVLAAPTVWGPGDPRQPVPVRDELEARWPERPVLLLNDLTAAGYGFVDEERPDVCVFTVSTGIGHKVFVDGRPLIGPGGRGGELGHLRVDFSPTAPRCECGGLGHLGAVASGSSTTYHLRTLAAEDPAAFLCSSLAAAGTVETIDNRAIARAFREGDPWAVRLVRRLAEPLGRALAAVHVAVGIERFVIIGGFGLALGPAFAEMASEVAASSAWDLGQDWSRMVELGRAGGEACLLGAGRYAVRCLS